MGMFASRFKDARSADTWPSISAIDLDDAGIPATSNPPGSGDGAAAPPPPSLPYDLSVLIPAAARPAQVPPRLPYDLAATGYPVRTPAAAAATCQLVPPDGQFRAANAIPLFQPQLADRLSAGIRALNNQGIVPTITSGYRTAERQQATRGGSYGSARGISGHQVGLSADFGPGHNPGLAQPIRDAMSDAGLANGDHFRISDPIHYMVPGTIRQQTAALAAACAAAYRGR